MNAFDRARRTLAWQTEQRITDAAEESTMTTTTTTYPSSLPRPEVPGEPGVYLITNRRQLEQLRQQLGCRPDWHEPDEQDVTIEFAPGEFDNAMTTPGIEAGVYVRHQGARVAYVNLALLFAFATGHYQGI